MDLIRKFKREWQEFRPLENTTTQQISDDKLVNYEPELKAFLITRRNGRVNKLTEKEARSLGKYFNRMFEDLKQELYNEG